MSEHFLQTVVNEETKIKLEVLKTKRGWTIKQMLRMALAQFLKNEARRNQP